MDDKVKRLIAEAFTAVCEAEAIIYASGITKMKQPAIEAHSAVLRLRNDYDAHLRARR